MTAIGDFAFSDCAGLVSIAVSKGNPYYDSRNNCNGIIQTATNTLISGCKSTKIPDSVTSIGNYAFEGCTGLTSLTIPDSVTYIGNFAFLDCTGLTSVFFLGDAPALGETVFYAFDWEGYINVIFQIVKALLNDIPAAVNLQNLRRRFLKICFSYQKKSAPRQRFVYLFSVTPESKLPIF